MRSYSTLIIFLILPTVLMGQTPLVVEVDAADGPERNLLILENFSNGSMASTGMRIEGGTSSSASVGSFAVTNLDYSAIPDWNGYLTIWSGESGPASGNGINFVAQEGAAKIRFYTLGAQPSNLRMTLLSNGHFGIGTPNPQERLQVENGDIYLSDVNSGVIMKSPNGTCFRMTVLDEGVPLFTELQHCPEDL